MLDCQNDTSCSGQGICNATGQCECTSPFAGVMCADCIPHHFTPTCDVCTFF